MDGVRGDGGVSLPESWMRKHEREAEAEATLRVLVEETRVRGDWRTRGLRRVHVIHVSR